ncbi:hypothetical protein B566_EDAN017683 [Ephemera danica]|nr:hypothetical protein B566_EDAN017683 [Ephemera danica]
MSTKLPREILSLKQFMVKRQVLQLYRDFFRVIRTVPDTSSRQELLTWVRHDFRANRDQKDEHTIQALLFNGQRSLNELRQSLQLSK